MWISHKVPSGGGVGRIHQHLQIPALSTPGQSTCHRLPRAGAAETGLSSFHLLRCSFVSEPAAAGRTNRTHVSVRVQCVHVCACAWVCVHAPVCACAWMCAFTFVHEHGCMCMHLCVCVHGCVHASVCTCARVHGCVHGPVCTCAWTCACTFVHKHGYVCMHLCACVDVCMHLCARVRMCMDVCMAVSGGCMHVLATVHVGACMLYLPQALRPRCEVTGVCHVIPLCRLA